MLDAIDWPMDGHGVDGARRSLQHHVLEVPFCFGKWAEEEQVRARGMDRNLASVSVVAVAIAFAVVVVVVAAAVDGGVAACIGDVAVVASSPSVGDGALCNVDPGMERLSSSWVLWCPELVCCLDWLFVSM
jgi:hypothetical protein